MLMSKDNSLLLIIDMQEGMINSIYHHQEVIANCEELIIMAQAFKIPIIASEHTPDKSGATIASLAKLLTKKSFIEKSKFSLYPQIKDKIAASESIIIAGIETHICVLQTAVEILEQGKQVFIVADAASAKFSNDHNYALQRIQQLGVQIVTTQMVLYELSRDSENSIYKKLAKRMVN